MSVISLYLYVEVGRIKRARGNEPGFSSPGVFGHELARAFHQEVTIPKCRHFFLPVQLQGWCRKQGRCSSFIYKQTNKTDQRTETVQKRRMRTTRRFCFHFWGTSVWQNKSLFLKTALFIYLNLNFIYLNLNFISIPSNIRNQKGDMVKK